MKLNKYPCIGLLTLFLIASTIVLAANGSISSEFIDPILGLLNHFKKDQVAQKKPLANSQKDSPYSKEIIAQILQQRYMAAMSQQTNTKNDGKDAESLEIIKEALNELHHNKDELERELAVLTLSEYTSDKAREGILYALNDSEAIVRDQAIVQISEWGDLKERQNMILSALNNKSSDIIVPVLESISHVDNPLLIKRLKHLSKSKNEEIREAAKSALELAE